MQGLMMDMPLLIGGLIQYAADYHGETEFYAAPGMGYVLHTINPRLSPGRDRCWIQLAFFRREIGIDDLLHVGYDRQSKGSHLFTQGGAVADHDLFEPRLPARAS